DMQNFDIACRIIYTMYWRAMEPPDLPMHEKNKTLFADWNDLVKGAEKDMERGLIITHEGCP
ncbi:MAG: hypothetical protein KAJ03_04055, partial [Gammaproteobacteria bacterium]|nr:hypothetical protein [Gammaproteobacteria bacterium]